MPRLLATVLVALPVGLIAGCSSQPPAGRSVSAAQVFRAANRTRDAKAALVTFSVATPDGAYRLRGRLDLRHGYRICARVEQTPPGGDRFYRRKLLWIEGRRGSYSDLIHGPPQRKPPGLSGGCPTGAWLDDHPPTLPLYRSRSAGAYFPPGGMLAADSGAEFFMHLSALALTQLKDGATVTEPDSRASSSPRSSLIEIDFRRFIRKPKERNEDSQIVRPLLRSVGKVPVRVTIDPRRRISSISFSTPNPIRRGPRSRGSVRVHLELSHIGEAGPVPAARATAME